MTPLRCALLLDTDNLYSALHCLDPIAAERFVADPSLLLDRLTQRDPDQLRRITLLHSYSNFSGALPAVAGKSRQFFGRWRHAFVEAGFEVIDCISPTYNSKNSADIRLCLAAMDSLFAPNTCYDEYVVGSNDTDFAPLLRRLRAAGKRTCLLSADAAPAAVCRGAADEVISLLELLSDEATAATSDEVTS